MSLSSADRLARNRLFECEVAHWSRRLGSVNRNSDAQSARLFAARLFSSIGETGRSRLRAELLPAGCAETQQSRARPHRGLSRIGGAAPALAPTSEGGQRTVRARCIDGSPCKSVSAASAPSRSRRNSSMRARIVAKSCAARVRFTSPPRAEFRWVDPSCSRLNRGEIGAASLNADT